MKQKKTEKERDRDKVVLKSENYIYFGQILNPYTYFGTAGVYN